MLQIQIQGNSVSLEETIDAFKKYYPNNSVKLLNDVVSETNELESGTIIINTIDSDAKSMEIARLNRLIDEKERELKESERTASKALLSIQSFHKQQQALFDEFVLLRQKYDEQKATLQNILWSHCSMYHPELRQIPPQENNDFVENDDQVGNYLVGKLLGEGQFATVRTCKPIKDENELGNTHNFNNVKYFKYFTSLFFTKL